MSASETETLLQSLIRHWEAAYEHWDQYNSKWMYVEKIPLLHTVMCHRHSARRESAKLLGELLHTQKQQKRDTREATSQARRGERNGWWLWLDRLDNEVCEEKAVLDSLCDDPKRMGQEEVEMLATWQANLALRDSQCRAALKFVLEFKAGAHADRKRLVKDSWARLTNPCFPREVLILVIEATVRSQAPCLILSRRPLRKFVDLIFARWPESMSRQTRGLIREIAARALLAQSIIGIIGGFTREYTLEFPPVLQSCEHFLRYLALEVGGWPSNGAYLWNLARSSQAMANMRLQLSNLETCVILYTFIHDDGAYFHYLPLITGGAPGSVERILAMRIFKSQDCADTLENWILQSIAAFREDGPGKRRFIQFSHFDDDKECLSAGPLVRVDDDLPHSTAPPPQSSTNQEHSSTTRRVFERAYWHDPRFRGSS